MSKSRSSVKAPAGESTDNDGQVRQHQTITRKDKHNISAESNIKRKRTPSSRSNSRSFFRRSIRLAMRHRWPIPLVPLLAVALLHVVNPSSVRRLIFPSYEIKQDNISLDDSNVKLQKYGKGPWDIAFVAFYTLVLSFTREFIMQEVLRPLARHCGIASRAKQVRFMEQMYTVIYFGVMGPAGLYIMRNRVPEVWFFNTRGMYESFPHRSHDAAFKFYYLFQAAYWAQQAIVMLLGLEKPRKDFKELVIHHIVTLALIALSYRFHFTYMGIAVYVTHDVSDFFLATGKSLQYTNSSFTVPAFAVCTVTWIYLRHFINLRILYSLVNGEFRTVGPYELDWETEQYKCWISNIITFTLLACLQALNIFWLYCLLRSFYRFFAYRVVKDDRSDDEEEEEKKKG